MPFYLKETEILPQLAGLRSILIVPCRFCPAVSLAIKENKPYIELFRRFLRTEAYESFIQILRRRIERAGIRTAVFDSKLPHQFVACMWTSARRRELAKRAAEFEGVLVLGCDATTEIVRNAIGSINCRVIQGMETEGIVNILPTVKLPLDISLKPLGITSVTTKPSMEQRSNTSNTHSMSV